jgi:DNA replication and repair protein RecF
LIVAELETTCFRNLGRQVVGLHPRFNLMIGENGQGKTNFLEAVYLVVGLESFRTNRSSDLVRFDERGARVRATVEGARGRSELEVRLDPINTLHFKLLMG